MKIIMYKKYFVKRAKIYFFCSLLEIITTSIKRKSVKSVKENLLCFKRDIPSKSILFFFFFFTIQSQSFLFSCQDNNAIERCRNIGEKTRLHRRWQSRLV